MLRMEFSQDDMSYEQRLVLMLAFASEHSGGLMYGPIYMAKTLVLYGMIQEYRPLAACYLYGVTRYVSQEEIRAYCGERLCGVVMELAGDRALARGERKTRRLDRASTLSLDAKRVTLARLFFKVSTVHKELPMFWSEQRAQGYCVWAMQMLQALRGALPNLEEAIRKKLEGSFEWNASVPCIPSSIDVESFLATYYVLCDGYK